MLPLLTSGSGGDMLWSTNLSALFFWKETGVNFFYVTRSLIEYFKLVRNTDSIDPMTNSSMLRPLWCGAYCKTHIWSTSICTNTNICLTDLYDASMVSSGLIYKLEKLADEAILSEALAIIPLWKFRAKTPPGFWNSKLHLITSPCLQNSNQETPQPPPPFSIV